MYDVSKAELPLICFRTHKSPARELLCYFSLVISEYILGPTFDTFNSPGKVPVSLSVLDSKWIGVAGFVMSSVKPVCSHHLY